MADGAVVLCGLGRVGRRVLDYLHAAGVPTVAIDIDDDGRDLPAGVTYICGDGRSPAVLEAAGVRTARGVIVCTGDDLANLAAAMTARRLNPDARLVVRMFNPAILARLGPVANNIAALSVSALTAPLLALIATTGHTLATFTTHDGTRTVAEIAVADGPLAGLSVREAGDRFRLLVLAHLPTEGEPRLLYDVHGDARLQPGDRLVVCATPGQLTALGGPAGSGSVRWASRLKRWGRVVGRTLGEIDPIVAATLTALLLAVGGSMLLFHHMSGLAWPAAMYRAVSIMATVGDMHGEGLPPWMQVYASVLRLTGAALTASATAILTNYLLRARLGGALEARRIPEGGHIVVAGLGNLGFRVCEELLKAGRKVVVIERDREGRFVSSARRAGVAVVVGDAALPAVLKQARTSTARALIAATGSELANVEIALLAREAKPDLRTVVRLSDAQFAEALREAAGLRLAFALPALAAPAFVAALYGDTVQAVFRAGGQLFAAAEIRVSAGDGCLDGQSVRAVTLDYRLMPVSLQSERPPGSQWLGHRLAAGDRLVAVALLSDLERLFRREPPVAGWSVRVESVPITARSVIAALLSERGLSGEAAATALEALPVELRSGLTRGQAEEWIDTLSRERVTASVQRDW